VDLYLSTENLTDKNDIWFVYYYCCVVFVDIPANFGGDMSRRPTNYGPNYGAGPGPAPGGVFQMQGPSYQAQAPGYQQAQAPSYQHTQYGHAGYSNPAPDIYDAGSPSYPTPVCRIRHY